MGRVWPRAGARAVPHETSAATRSLFPHRVPAETARGHRYVAERAVGTARFELDDWIFADHKGSADAGALSGARNRLADATERLRHEQLALAAAQSRPNLPSPIALKRR
jgi:hypothetical protein